MDDDKGELKNFTLEEFKEAFRGSEESDIFISVEKNFQPGDVIQYFSSPERHWKEMFGSAGWSHTRPGVGFVGEGMWITMQN